jgi:hypothetical protein
LGIAGHSDGGPAKHSAQFPRKRFKRGFGTQQTNKPHPRVLRIPAKTRLGIQRLRSVKPEQLFELDIGTLAGRIQICVGRYYADPGNQRLHNDRSRPRIGPDGIYGMKEQGVVRNDKLASKPVSFL